MRGNKVGIADLKRLQRSLREEHAGPAPRTAGKAVPAPAPEALDDDEIFRRATRTTQPLRAAPRVVHPKALEPAVPQALARRAAAIGEPPARADKGVSDGDLSHMLSENGTAFVRDDVAPDTARRLRKGQWRVGAELDLHGLRVEQARHALVTFLNECTAQGIRCARVVHGKGYGSRDMEPVLRDRVRSWLIQIDTVLAFSDAPEKDGGAGAVIALLSDQSAYRR